MTSITKKYYAELWALKPIVNIVGKICILLGFGLLIYDIIYIYTNNISNISDSFFVISLMLLLGGYILFVQGKIIGSIMEAQKYSIQSFKN